MVSSKYVYFIDLNCLHSIYFNLNTFKSSDEINIKLYVQNS